MFLGDKWEHLFKLGGTLLRAHGPRALAPGRHWIELPASDLWVF